MDVFEATHGRQSIRKFTDEPVPGDVLEKLFRAAMAPQTPAASDRGGSSSPTTRSCATSSRRLRSSAIRTIDRPSSSSCAATSDR